MFLEFRQLDIGAVSPILNHKMFYVYVLLQLSVLPLINSLALSSNSGSSGSSSSSNSGSASLPNRESPWASSTWQFQLNLGREEGTWMPDEWGASGGRLVLPVEVEIDSSRLSSTDELDPMLLRNAFSMKPQQDKSPTTYITTEKGEQRCEFGKEGGWKIRLPSGRPQGYAAKLMAYLDLKSDVRKNDIILKKGERIYLTGKCWREEELDRALLKLYPIQRTYIEKQKKLDAALRHETGDRRLDGTDPLQTLMGMKDTAQLVLDRDEALRNYEDAKRVYPTIIPETTAERITANDIDLPEGPWPGQVEWLSIEPLYLLVRRQKLFGEEYHVIGTWSATPLYDPSLADDEEPSIF